MQDTDFPAHAMDESLNGTNLRKWYKDIVAGAAAMGRNLGIAKNYKGWMEEIGFVDVEEIFFSGQPIHDLTICI
jgi:hypothetical protein